MCAYVGSSVLKREGDRRTFLSVTGAALLGVCGLQSSDSLYSIAKAQSPETMFSSELVTAQGRELRLGGKPYRFVGVNRYNLLTPAGGTCGVFFSDKELVDWFREMGRIGISVVRFWLFESVTKGDLERFERVLELAAENSIKTIPVFEDEWSYCSPVDRKYAGANGRKNALWYREGYQIAYKPYVERIVARYARDPRVLMWQLMNEAESADSSALSDFSQDMSASVRKFDKNHLISLGTIGNNIDGIDEESYRALHRDPNISLLEYHDYHEPQSSLPDALAERFSDAQFLNKPLFVGEAGIPIDPSMTSKRRAELLRAKMEAFFSRGGVGYAIWSGPNVDQTRSASYGFVLSDVLVSVMSEMARKYCGFRG